MTDPEFVIEWALMLDCEKQGCSPRHGDHGRIFDIGRTKPEEAFEIGSHATTIVSRSVRYLPWVPAQP